MLTRQPKKLMDNGIYTGKFQDRLERNKQLTGRHLRETARVTRCSYG